jgi:hypothetical protein
MIQVLLSDSIAVFAQGAYAILPEIHFLPRYSLLMYTLKRNTKLGSNT